MIDPDLRSAPFSFPQDPFKRQDAAAGSTSAAVFLGIYLGVVVGFGALMGQLVRVAGG